MATCSPTCRAGRMAGPRGLLRKGGLLLVTSTYCWSERTAASQLWLGGTTDSEGNPVRCGAWAAACGVPRGGAAAVADGGAASEGHGEGGVLCGLRCPCRQRQCATLHSLPPPSIVSQCASSASEPLCTPSLFPASSNLQSSAPCCCSSAGLATGWPPPWAPTLSWWRRQTCQPPPAAASACTAWR